MRSLIDLIKQHTPLPFDQYMDLALYHPEFGYYARRVDFGALGDFVTAPTLTPEFAHAVGRFLLRLATQDIVELGPGNGQLAYDLLLFLDAHDELPQHYYLVETSDHLKNMQYELLMRLPAHLFSLIRWVSLDDLQNLSAVIIANEFFDALPVVRFTVTPDGIKELYVSVLNDKFVEVTHEARAEIIKLIAPLQLPLGFTSEICLAYEMFATLLNHVIKQGIILVMDYGYTQQEYYQPQRRHGTLQAYYQHQALNDYLAQPGFMDLTAHVNFSFLGQCLLTANFSFEFFTYQNVFLLDHGIQEGLEKKSVSIQQKIKRLLDPRLMGEQFKVLGFSKNIELDYRPQYELGKFL